MRLHELIEDARVVKGVNTTVDVDVDEIKTQTGKFGNDVDICGYPEEDMYSYTEKMKP